MPFNLNKNGDGQKTKFDLSKNEANITGHAQGKRSGGLYWLLGILFIAAIGAGWYFTAGKANPATAESQEAAIVPPPVDTTQLKTRPGTLTDTTATAIPAKDSIPAEAEMAVAASFQRGSFALRGLSKAAIKKLAGKLGANTSFKLTVNGYASSEGSLLINQAISQARADAFKRYLVRKGAPAGKISAIGKGIEDPIASNDTEAGRAKNRRVEVILQ